MALLLSGNRVGYQTASATSTSVPVGRKSTLHKNGLAQLRRLCRLHMDANASPLRLLRWKISR